VGAGYNLIVKAAIEQKDERSASVARVFKRQKRPSSPASFDTNGGERKTSNKPEEEKQETHYECHRANFVPEARNDGKRKLREFRSCMSVDDFGGFEYAGLGAAGGQGRYTQITTSAVGVGHDRGMAVLSEGNLRVTGKV
jgi:hypothetical protein